VLRGGDQNPSVIGGNEGERLVVESGRWKGIYLAEKDEIYWKVWRTNRTEHKKASGGHGGAAK